MKFPASWLQKVSFLGAEESCWAFLDLTRWVDVQRDEQRKKQCLPLICLSCGEKTLRAWWEARRGKSVEEIVLI